MTWGLVLPLRKRTERSQRRMLAPPGWLLLTPQRPAALQCHLQPEQIGFEAAVTTSRTTLDRRFRKHLNRTPSAEIPAVRIRRARQLLGETDHPIHRIAELVGFRHAEYFHFAFKRECGITPARFRQDSRAGAPAAPRGNAF